jgi:hypothetical protein
MMNTSRAMEEITQRPEAIPLAFLILKAITFLESWITLSSFSNVTAMGQMTKVHKRGMRRLGHNLSKMKDNFIVVHLRSRRFAAAVERGEDVSKWLEDSDEELVRSKRAKISGKDFIPYSEEKPTQDSAIEPMTEIVTPR